MKTIERTKQITWIRGVDRRGTHYLRPIWYQRLACFFGFHVPSPYRWTPSQAYYHVTCHNGDTDWYERCPRCRRWHHSANLNREFEALDRVRYELGETGERALRSIFQKKYEALK